MKFTLEFYKEDPSGKKRKRVLIAEQAWDTKDSDARDIAMEAGTLLEEAVECNVDATD